MMRLVVAHSVFELIIAGGAFWHFVTVCSLMIREI